MKPWERYQEAEDAAQPSGKPWERYQAAEAAAKTSWADVGADVSHFGERAVRGATALPTLALHGLEAATGRGLSELTGGFVQDLEDSAIGKQLENIPEAKTGIGRYGGAISEAVGGLLPGAGAIGGLGRLTGSGFLTRAAARPLSGLNLASGVGAGVGQQAAEDADLGNLGQFGGALAGGIAAPLGAQGLMRSLGAAGRAGESGALTLGRAPAAGAPGGPAGPPRPPPGGYGPGGAPSFQELGPERPWWIPKPGSYEAKVDASTNQMLADIATKQGIPPEEVGAFIREAKRSGTFHSTGTPLDPLMTMAEADTGFAGAVGSAVRQDPAAAREARAILKARKTGNMPLSTAEQEAVERAGIPTAEVMDPERYTRAAIKEQPVGLLGRTIQGFRKALRIDSDPHHGFGGTVDETHSMIEAAQKAASAPAYNSVWLAGGVRPPTGTVRGTPRAMVDVGANPGVKAVFDRYKALADPNVTPPDIAATYQKALNQFSPTGNKVHASIWYVDQAKQAVDEQINKLLNSSNDRAPTLARNLIQMKNDLLDAIDGIKTNKLGDRYAKAREVFAGPEELKRDLQLGRDIYAGKAGRGEFDAAKDRAQKNRIKHGYHSAFAHEAMQKQSGADLTRLLASEQKRMEASGLIERSAGAGDVYRDRPQRFGRFMQGQEQQLTSERIISGGSQTAERSLQDVQFSVLHQISDIAKDASAREALMRTGEMVLNKMFGMPSDRAVNLTRKVLSTDPHVQRYTLNQMKMLMGSSKMQRFLDIMERQSRGMPVGTLSGVTATAGQGLE